MAKALFGHVASDPRSTRVQYENALLRRRVADLEALVARLMDENDRLVAGRAEELTADALADAVTDARAGEVVTA
ncbi:hypothetical protein [Nocardioides yefusunii]|uniref:Uncharacterized protein n=1 Tax=Nocardioides yefusunii TaxID=2500546 RepID=A0ABW1QYH8_9ACTN|nr:hypothetical protein [Nocardioides yefusunii]